MSRNTRVLEKSTAEESLVFLYAKAWRKKDAGVLGILSRSPSESTLLSLVMISCFIQMLGNIGAILLYADPAQHYELVLASIVATLFFLPLVYYGFSLAVGKICQMFGGKGSMFETRAAVFWVLALVSPFVALVDVMPAHLYLSIVVGFTTAYLLSASLRTVHQFTSRTKVFMCLVSVPVVASILVGLTKSGILLT